MSDIRNDVYYRIIDFIKHVAHGNGNVAKRIHQSLRINRGGIKKKAYISPVDTHRKQPGSKKSLKEKKSKQSNRTYDIDVKWWVLALSLKSGGDGLGAWRLGVILTRDHIIFTSLFQSDHKEYISAYMPPDFAAINDGDVVSWNNLNLDF